MSLFDNLNGLLGKRPSEEPPAPGYEHFGGEPADPRNSRYWRSIPHPVRIAIPTMADSPHRDRQPGPRPRSRDR